MPPKITLNLIAEKLEWIHQDHKKDLDYLKEDLTDVKRHLEEINGSLKTTKKITWAHSIYFKILGTTVIALIIPVILLIFKVYIFQ